MGFSPSSDAANARLRSAIRDSCHGEKRRCRGAKNSINSADRSRSRENPLDGWFTWNPTPEKLAETVLMFTSAAPSEPRADG